MKHTGSAVTSLANAVTLFDDPRGGTFESRLRAFAREVAKRHRGRPADVGALVLALRGYYRTWSLFERLPPLDERGVGWAVSEYQAARTGRRTSAA